MSAGHVRMKWRQSLMDSDSALGQWRRKEERRQRGNGDTMGPPQLVMGDETPCLNGRAGR